MGKNKNYAKVALLDVRKQAPNYKKSFTVTFRNFLILQQYLKADLYNSISSLKHGRADYDSIICGFGRFYTEIDLSTKFLQKNKKAKLFWLVGEYEQSTFQPLFYAKREYHVIKNFIHKMKGKQISSQHFININALIVSPLPSNLPDKRKYGSIYYGRWRPDRGVYLKEYLQNGVYLSTSIKNMKKFKYLGCNPIYIKPLIWQKGIETLRLFTFSLYLEDVFTHSHYNCPANRFYEALSLGTIVIPHIESKPTWDTAGYNMDGRYVGSFVELKERIHTFPIQEIRRLQEQQKEWNLRAQQEKTKALEQIKNLVLS
jgi:hypothetical protein